MSAAPVSLNAFASCVFPGSGPDIQTAVPSRRDQLRVEARGLVLLVPQFLVLRVGPAWRQGAVYQDNTAPDHLDGLPGVGNELLEHRFHERDEYRHDPRYRGLRDIVQVADAFLGDILPEINAGYLHRLIQAA